MTSAFGFGEVIYYDLDLLWDIGLNIWLPGQLCRSVWLEECGLENSSLFHCSTVFIPSVTQIELCVSDYVDLWHCGLETSNVLVKVIAPSFKSNPMLPLNLIPNQKCVCDISVHKCMQRQQWYSLMIYSCTQLRTTEGSRMPAKLGRISGF